MRPRPSKRTFEKVDTSTSIKEVFASYNSKADPIDTTKKVKIKDLGGARVRPENDAGVIDPDTPDEYMEERIAFCCYQCFCTDEIKKQIPVEDPFIQSSLEGLYHRRCCHKVIDPDEDWVSPFEHAVEELCLQEDEICHNVMTLPELEAQFNIALRHQSALYNADGLPEFASLLQTSAEYIENQKRFFQIPKQTSADDDDAIVVLDMFAGIGSGIVALKRLGIPMKTIIHVEHDPVANHVYKWNHDKKYNDSLSEDSIEHVYVDRFEQFEDDNYFHEFLARYGPIDFVIGGPPCIDYSKLNAYREGINGIQGGYMPRFGTLIQKIQRHQPDHHVFFLAENTILSNDIELNLEDGDLESIKESFGVQWAMNVDASCFTPGRRNRTYISNIPLLTKADDYILDEELVDSPYLTDDFVHCVHFLCDHLKVPRIPVKVACLLASKGRIDAHPTMTVVKTNIGNDNKEYIERRPFNVKERESVMGFPVGYVEDAVKDLFENLQQKGYGNTRLAEYEPYWKESLPQKYHLFGGLPVRFYSSDYVLCAKLRPPKVNSVNDFFEQEQYGKRLIGNAFSVPVVEILLRQLQTKFSKREYKDYTYNYVWRTSRVRVKHEDEH